MTVVEPRKQQLSAHAGLANSRIRFLVVVPVVVLVWFSTRSHLLRSSSPSRPNTSPPSQSLLPKTRVETENMSDNPSNIEYRLVEEGEFSMQRYMKYAAVYVSNNDAPVSVESWSRSVGKFGPSASFIEIFRSSPFHGYFFETKGVSRWTKNKQFEFVLVDAPRLASFAELRPDPDAFSEHLSKCSFPGCAFPNLGNNAMLIAPVKPEEESDDRVFSHLAAFCLAADDSHVSGLFRIAAKEYHNKLQADNETVWFSTSGMGVAWLHFRLDQSPKYYQFKPFAKER